MSTAVIVYICSDHLLAVVWECDWCGYQHCADMCWVCCCWCRYNLWRNQQYSTQHNCQTHPAGLWQLRVLLITVICNGCIVSVCVCCGDVTANELCKHESHLLQRIWPVLSAVHSCGLKPITHSQGYTAFLHFNLKFLFACWQLFSPRSQSFVEISVGVDTLYFWEH